MAGFENFMATQDEIAKHQLASTAYKKMLTGKLLTPEESVALKTVVKTVNDLKDVKASNGVIEEAMPLKDKYNLAASFDKVAKAKANIKNFLKSVGVEDVEEAEKENKKRDKENEEIEEKNHEKEEKEVNKEPESEKEPKEEKIEEIKDEKSTSKHAAPSMDYTSAPSDQDVFLASMLKDTPYGNYANTMAKAHAETENAKKHYTDAFQRLRGSADNGGFERMLQEAPELAEPMHVESAQKYYRTLSNFAPSLALDPVVAASFVKKVNAYGGLDEKMVQGLITANNDHMKHHSSMAV